MRPVFLAVHKIATMECDMFDVIIKMILLPINVSLDVHSSYWVIVT